MTRHVVSVAALVTALIVQQHSATAGKPRRASESLLDQFRRNRVPPAHRSRRTR
jgi:hypothetical protein